MYTFHAMQCKHTFLKQGLELHMEVAWTIDKNHEHPECICGIPSTSASKMCNTSFLSRNDRWLMPKVTRLPLRNPPAVETASQRGMPMPNKSPKFTSCVRNVAPNSNVLLSTIWKSCQEACYSDMLSEMMVCSKRHKRLECFEWFNLQKKIKK